MSHCTNTGESKLVEHCSYPLTGPGVVSRIFTDLAVVHVAAGRFVLRKLLPGIGFEQIQSLTGAELHVESEVLNLETPQFG